MAKTASEIMQDQIFDQQKTIRELHSGNYTEARTVQAKLDPIYRAFGDTINTSTKLPITKGSAPALLDGEHPTDYLRRNLEDLKRFSPDWEKTDIKALPAPALAIAERQICADALAEAAKPTARSLPPDGSVVVKICKDTMGISRFREYHSANPSAVWSQFKRPTQYVRRWGDEKSGQDAFKL
jgi:hypothetical protein